MSDKDKLKDIRQQVFKKGTAGALSAYGNLLDLIHAQTREKQTPGQEALTQAEFESPTSLLPFHVLPRYTRLPSQREAETFIEMLGGEAKTEAGIGEGPIRCIAFWDWKQTSSTLGRSAYTRTWRSRSCCHWHRTSSFGSSWS